MIDLHSHVLPALDDGSPDDATSLEMCRLAADDGITTLVATPHFANGLGPSDSSLVSPAVARLQAFLDQSGISLSLRCAVEMPLLDNLPALYKSGTWLAYDPSRRYLLFEMPDLPFRALDILARSVSTLHLLGAVPVLAHPERLHFLDDLQDARHIRRLGAVFQITAQAIFSDSSDGTRARLWLDEGLVACVASDAHDTRHRPPLLSRARQWLADRYGDPAADALTRGNPERILSGAPLP